MNSRSRALENSDIEDLFYVFSETVLKNGNFRYKEFSSWKEIENWQTQGKIVEAYLVLSYKGEPFMTDIQRIYNSLLRHFSSPDKAEHFGIYNLGNKNYLPSRLIYIST